MEKKGKKYKKVKVEIIFNVDEDRPEDLDECLARAYYCEPGDMYIHLQSYKSEIL